MLKKQKPVQQKNVEPTLNGRILQLQEEAASLAMEYKLDDYDVAELVFDKYCEKFPDTYFVDITKMVRAQKDRKDFLVYYTSEECTDAIKFKKHRFNRKRIGFHSVVTGEPEYSEYGELQNYNIGTSKTSFDIPFTADKVKEIIASARSGPKELLLAVGATTGEQPLLEPIRSCFNLDNFLHGEFDSLMEAGRLCYLNTGSGYEEFLKVRASAQSYVDTIKKENGPNKEREK